MRATQSSRALPVSRGWFGETFHEQRLRVNCADWQLDTIRLTMGGICNDWRMNNKLSVSSHFVYRFDAIKLLSARLL